MSSCSVICQNGGSSSKLLEPPAGVALAHGSSKLPPPPAPPVPPPEPKPPPPELLRDIFCTFAVAYRSEGPISSTSSSMTVRFSPSRVSYDRWRSRPVTTTRAPRCSDSATFSAACRHTVQDRKSGSPSFHSLVCRSRKLGVEATRNFATAAPDGVKRSSGSSVRLPMTVMVVSPAMPTPRAYPVRRAARAQKPHLFDRPRLPHGNDDSGISRAGASARVGPDDLGTQYRLVEPELPVQFGYGGGRGLQLDHRVDAFGLLVDLEGKAAPSPDIELLDRTARCPDHVAEIR